MKFLQRLRTNRHSIAVIVVISACILLLAAYKIEANFPTLIQAIIGCSALGFLLVLAIVGVRPKDQDLINGNNYLQDDLSEIEVLKNRNTSAVAESLKTWTEKTKEELLSPRPLLIPKELHSVPYTIVSQPPDITEEEILSAQAKKYNSTFWMHPTSNHRQQIETGGESEMHIERARSNGFIPDKSKT